MISLKKAYEIILQNQIEIGEERVPLQLAKGRVLAQEIHADRDFPPFDRVTMDGIAFQYAQFKIGRIIYKIESIAAAGAPQVTLNDEIKVVEVMTGAMLPVNTDTVMRYEDIEIAKSTLMFRTDNIKDGQNVHRKGTDRKKGDLLVKPGKQITAAEIGVAATVGAEHIVVKKKIKIAVISTGDELVNVDEIPLPHQIRKSNVHSIVSLLDDGISDVSIFHLLDDKDLIFQGLQNMLQEFEVLILSGGVSKGKYDFIPEVLKELQVEKLFHKVAQRPGKPFWFGKHSSGTIVFALPGNPVSSFSCTNRFVNPWIRKCLGLNENETYAILQEDFSFKPNLTYFLQVKIEETSGAFKLAFPFVGNGSGDLANLTEVDGFLELDADKEVFMKGEVYRYWGIR